ncbi:MAG: ABC transporter substrate-binding protein [Paludibacteraceae bacterium]|nr:ABC transporter substrate-binding protein [Paludibacteraceae bacterium]
MKKILFSLLTAMTVLTASAADREHTLKIYNWADYIDFNVLEEFKTWYTEQTGEEIEIIYNTFDINENMLTEIEIGKEDYDVICPSEYIIERMLKRDLLLPIEKDIIPDSLRYFDLEAPFVTEKFQQMAPSSDIRVADYTVGYMWGTTGFLYNTKFINPEEVSTWGAITNVERFAGRILMKDAFRDIYSVIILYAYRDEIARGELTRDELVANITPERIARVEEVLMAGKECYAGWEVDFGKEEMTKGKTWLDLMWSGDAQWAIDECEGTEVELRYIVPEEGSNVWFDGWCIPRYAVNTKAASYFIAYMCRPDNAIRNMEEIGYVSVIASPEIEEWANDEEIEETADLSYFFGPEATAVHANQVFYPDKSVIDRCALMHDAGAHAEDLMKMWNRVKGDNLNTRMVIIIVIICAAILVLVIVQLIGRKRQRNLQTKKKNKRK